MIALLVEQRFESTVHDVVETDTIGNERVRIERPVREHVDDHPVLLARPLFCHLGTASEDGPRVSPLWFLWEDGAIWIIATLSNKTFPNRIEEDPRTAVSIGDFDPKTGRVEHVGLRGHATIEPFEGDRGERLLSQYLGSDESEWDDQFQDLGDVAEKYTFIRFVPETVVERDQSYSGSLS